jgi:hypothetical protein
VTLSAENEHALDLADQLRWVLEDDADASQRAMIKAATLVLAGLLVDWPAETREREAEIVVDVLAAALAAADAEDGETDAETDQ